MNCALMFIMSNHYGRKFVSNLVQLEPCNDMFKVISDIMAHCYDMCNTTINELCIDVFIISNNDGIKCVSNLVQLEPCNDMFKVISDIMAHCYYM